MASEIWFEEDNVSKGSAWVLVQKLNQPMDEKTSWRTSEKWLGEALLSDFNFVFLKWSPQLSKKLVSKHYLAPPLIPTMQFHLRAYFCTHAWPLSACNLKGHVFPSSCFLFCFPNLIFKNRLSNAFKSLKFIYLFICYYYYYYFVFSFSSLES